LLVGEAEARDVDLRDRDRDDVFALLADQLALADVAAQVLADATTDDVLEASVVLIHSERHAALTVLSFGEASQPSARRRVLARASRARTRTDLGRRARAKNLDSGVAIHDETV
jgi:hypothetical protein